MAKFCQNCGAALEGAAKFCQSCGAKQPEEAVPAVVPETAPTAVQPPRPAEKEAGQQQYSPYAGQQTAGNPSQHGPSFGQGAAAFGAASFGAAASMSGARYVEDQTLQEKFMRYDNRLNRKRFIMRHLMIIAASFLASSIAVFIAIVTFDSNSADTIAGLISVCLAVPAMMLNIRRMHDLDRSGWWCLGLFVPLLNVAVALYLLCAKGTQGENQYGPDPLEGMD